MRRTQDCAERYGVPVDLIAVCIAAIVICCLIMLGIEVVKDLLGY